MHKFILALASAALLASCETETHASFAIQNDSDSRISISGTSHYSGLALDKTIAVGNVEIIDAFQKRGADMDTLSPIDII